MYEDLSRLLGLERLTVNVAELTPEFPSVTVTSLMESAGVDASTRRSSSRSNRSRTDGNGMP